MQHRFSFFYDFRKIWSIEVLIDGVSYKKRNVLGLSKDNLSAYSFVQYRNQWIHYEHLVSAFQDKPHVETSQNFCNAISPLSLYVRSRPVYTLSVFVIVSHRRNVSCIHPTTLQRRERYSPHHGHQLKLADSYSGTRDQHVNKELFPVYHHTSRSVIAK